jgi:hypothetical protein
MLSIAMDELEDAIVRELSANLDLQRLQDMHETFRHLQQSFVSQMQDTSSPFPIDRKARAFSVVDGLLAYASMKRLKRIIKCPTYEEVGQADGFWSMENKITALRCKQVGSNWKYLARTESFFVVFLYI